MDPIIVPIIGLAIITTAGYFYGRKKNRWISSWISKESEDVFAPLDATYTNIGGSIGYNFHYDLKAPLKDAKGSFTLLPRQSILYLPLSLFIARHDRYYLTVFTEKKLLGEAHALRSDYYRKIRSTISGEADMERAEVRVGRRDYMLLWDKKPLEAELRRLIDRCGESGRLLHFCCYRDNRNFFVHAVPVRTELKALLETIARALPAFMHKAGDTAGGNNGS